MSTTFTTTPPSRNDPLWRVHVHTEGDPHAYVLGFPELKAEDGETAIPLAEATITQAPADVPEEARMITGPVVRDFADHLHAYEQAARFNLTRGAGRAGAATDRFSRGPRTRRELSEGFLRDVVRRHAEFRERGLSPTLTLARDEGVSPSTVKHWLRKAREAGIDYEPDR
jgi:hypothetical protein